MKKLLIILICVFSLFQLKAFNFTVQGIVYFNNSYYVAANETLIFYVNGKLQSDSVLTQVDGLFTVNLQSNSDSLNIIEIYALDCERQGVNEPIEIFEISEPGYYSGFKLKICSKKLDPCEVYFRADSIDEQTVHFNDSLIGNIVQLQWFFGDGQSTTEWNPEHFYSAPGEYFVRLHAQTADSTNCLASDSIIIKKTSNLFGEVHLNLTSLDSGKVYSNYYRNGYGWAETENSNIEFETGIERGLFKIHREVDVSTYVQIIPDFENSDTQYPVYFPTYYKGSFYWNDAKQFSSNKKDSLKVDLLKRDDIFYGYGTITGQISIPANYTHVNMKRVIVFLLDSTAQHPLKYSYIESDGSFVFNNVPMDKYNILVDIIGVPVSPLEITLRKEHPDKIIQYTLGEPVYTTIENDMAVFAEISAYPNPFNESLNINIGVEKYNAINIELINIAGSVVFSKVYESVQGVINIDASDLQPGLYLLKTPYGTTKVIK